MQYQHIFLILGLSIFGSQAEDFDSFMCTLLPLASEDQTSDDWFGKWYYDQPAKRCFPVPSGYSGAQGNTFTSEKSCYNTCQTAKEICTSPLDSGTCRGSFSNLGFSPEAGSCVEFIYGGCNGNGNRFNSLKECHMTCGEFMGGK
ncbi:inter-alpha-trypsin inhibitor-like [Periplaneta americana]|uniref:inter-alpha-trypsin inhibitor-like n=1 Tax=Periplaneta americana TaxID=6978 RepID=UPI0037E78894